MTEPGEVASNLVLVVPEAQPAVDLCNSAMPAAKRLTAPAHITLVYPFMAPTDLNPATRADLRLFFAEHRPVRFVLDIGWFGREVLLLRPDPEHDVIELTESITSRWPEYPYYGGAYDKIEPHLSLAFGEPDLLEPLADSVAEFLPMEVRVTEVTLLVGPHDAMRIDDRFRLDGVE